MVRRECYEKLGAFPLDASWAGERVDFGWNGDWYLWCLFSLFYDVAYFAEPMICYREHDLAMTSIITRPEYVENCSAAEIGMLWLIREKALASGVRRMADDCLLAIANEYARQAGVKQYRRATSSLTIDQFEDSLCRSTANGKERNWIRARFFVGMGDRSFMRGDAAGARAYYLAGMRHDFLMPKAAVKLALLGLGKRGNYVRRLLRSRRTAATS
jgi:hypothetical protein